MKDEKNPRSDWTVNLVMTSCQKSEAELVAIVVRRHATYGCYRIIIRVKSTLHVEWKTNNEKESHLEASHFS